MGRTKIQNRNIRRLNKTSGGKSYGITLPIEIIRKFKWQCRQKLRLLIDEKKKKVTIQDWEPKRKK